REDEAVLTVADNGPGVPEDERARIFDRFFRLERSRSTPGSGLGLALVAAVARLHDASVGLADAAPGLQVRVTFRLSGRGPDIEVSQSDGKLGVSKSAVSMGREAG
ncbi:MAG: sensor histidine kinase, partial [Caulobacteraceae bacterium]